MRGLKTPDRPHSLDQTDGLMGWIRLIANDSIYAMDLRKANRVVAS
jgi:hypothetical protein